MQMHQVRYFLALADHLNFTRAAEASHVSQPALTRAIKALEDEFGGDLIIREGRTTHLSELGKRVLPLLEQVYASAASAKAIALSINSGEVVPLAVAVSHGVNVEVLMVAIAELFRSFPGMEISILRGSDREVATLLQDGDCDICIASRFPNFFGAFQEEEVYEEDFAVIVPESSPFAEQGFLELDSLEGQTLMVQAGCAACESLSESLREVGIGVSIKHRLETFNDVTAIAKAGLALTLVPVSAPESAGVKAIPLRHGMRRSVFAYSALNRDDKPIVNTLIALLRAEDWSRFRNRELD